MLYRPRMAAIVTVPVFGTTREKILQGADPELVTLPVRVRRASWEWTDFNSVDSLEIEAEWRDIGLDPRTLSGATVQFYLGNEEPGRLWTPTEGDLRFVGVMVRPARKASPDGFTMSLQFYDYSTLFIETGKKFPADGIPHYGMDLAEAWAHICDHVGPLDTSSGRVFSTVKALRSNIVFEGGIGAPPVIGSAVNRRIRQIGGPVAVKPNTDAWATWVQCVGLLGLVTFMRNDQCVVTTATDYYTVGKRTPRLAWGKNILELHEERNAAFAPAGVGVNSFDPLSYTELEALWPPIGDQRAKKKNVPAKKAPAPHSSHAKAKTAASQSEEAVINGEDRAWYDYPGVTDPDRLLEIAKRIYEERAHQELQGTATTREMTIERLDGTAFDLLTLRAGDDICIDFEEDVKASLKSIGSVQQRIAYLVARGYSSEVAALMVKNMQGFDRLPATFFVKSVHGEFSVDKDGGEFVIHVNYVNKIGIDGAAT